MKRIDVQIFTEEYQVIVFIGKRSAVIEAAALFIGQDRADFKKEFVGRGQCITSDENEHLPVVVVDGALPVDLGLAVLAHEASHAMDWIADYIGMRDKSGEFKAHGIAAVMRQVQAQFKGFKGKKGVKKG